MSDIATIANFVSQSAPVVEQIAEALAAAYGAGPAANIAIKIAAGAAAKLPDAVALVEQFQSGTVPTQSELDAYAKAEDSSYAKLMADIAVARATAT